MGRKYSLNMLTQHGFQSTAVNGSTWALNYMKYHRKVC